MRTSTIAIVVALLLCPLAGCGSEPDAGQGNAAPWTVPDNKATPTSAAMPKEPLNFGMPRMWTAEGNEGSSLVSVAVQAYTQPVEAFDFPTDYLAVDDPEWATVKIRACVLSGVTTVFSQVPWALDFPDDTRLRPPVATGSKVPADVLSREGMAVAPGDCVITLMPFAVSKGKRPIQIVYEPQGTDPLSWTVPAE